MAKYVGAVALIAGSVLTGGAFAAYAGWGYASIAVGAAAKPMPPLRPRKVNPKPEGKDNAVPR